MVNEDPGNLEVEITMNQLEEISGIKKDIIQNELNIQNESIALEALREKVRILANAIFLKSDE
ncbi:MAG: hypothetical protein H6621_10530 [Halobacteriovoraceae bacterium]|nr:hypothetical protein [Halobacteriovoraceae bacterium]MCB9095492.1 hypothetical protein [Halobacteriovoraceae bacterium]